VTAAHVPQWLKSTLDWLALPHKNVDDNHRTILFAAIDSRLGYLLATPNVCLLAAAVHPKHRHLDFVSDELKNKIWEDIGEEACIYNRVTDSAEMQSLWRSSTMNQVKALRLHIRSAPQDSDPLIYYPQKCSQYAVLFPFLKQILSIPATSAPSERLFKPSKRTVTKDRNRLTPGHVEMFSVIRCYVNEHRDENGRFNEEAFFAKVKNYIEKRADEIRIMEQNVEMLENEDDTCADFE
jgi:hypothetical protein